MNIRIGTRGSDLARWQAEYIKDKLSAIGINSELVIIKTKGDQIQNIGFDKMEGKGFFTKELEDALLNHEVDIAVHSLKDMPTGMVPGLCIAAVTYREDPSELLLIHPSAKDDKQRFGLKKNALTGTSSSRRKSQLLALRPDLQLKDLRGNVPGRVDKVRKGDYDAILIAVAGFDRLKLQSGELGVYRFSPEQFIPAPAQGVVAVQCRSNDADVIHHISQINDEKVNNTVSAERKVLQGFDGGCQLPLGVYASLELNDDGVNTYKLSVAKAKSFNHVPLYYRQTGLSNFEPETVLNEMGKIKACKVFISRNLPNLSLFRRSLIDNGFTVEGQALIETLPLNIKNIPETDWVFFSSKQAVEYFYKAKPDFKGPKIGVIGKSTADTLRALGHRASFIGQHANTTLTGKQFAALAGRATVLFPGAKESMQSIQHQLHDQSKVFNLAVYQTIEKVPASCPQADIYVFTSPSNVRAFFKEFKPLKGVGLVAMGEATANELMKQKLSKVLLAYSFDDIGLLQAVYQCSTQL